LAPRGSGGGPRSRLPRPRRRMTGRARGSDQGASGEWWCREVRAFARSRESRRCRGPVGLEPTTYRPGSGA
jgi:hypothetical protein